MPRAVGTAHVTCATSADRPAALHPMLVEDTHGERTSGDRTRGRARGSMRLW